MAIAAHPPQQGRLRNSAKIGPKAMAPLPAEPPVPQRQTLLLCAMLAATTLLVYSRALRNGFVDYDDRTYITANTHIQGGLNWATIRWAATSVYAGNWHPATWLSHALDWQWFGKNAGGHHAVS